MQTGGNSLRELKLGKFRTLTIGKRIALLVTALAAATFSMPADHNIENRLLVHALGIDRTDDGYEVSFQVFRSSGAGADIPIDISRSNVQLIKEKARTVSEAVDKCSAQLGRDVFLGHLQVICFGRNTDFSSPEELFSFALKDRSVFLGVEVCMAEDRAEEVIMQELDRGTVSSENLFKALKEGLKGGRTEQCSMLSFLSCIRSPQFFAVPVVKLSEQGGEKKESVIDVSGTAVISEGRVRGILDDEEGYGLSLLRDRSEHFDTVIEKDGRRADVRFDNADTDCRLTREGDKLIFSADIELSASVSLDIKGSEFLSEEELSQYVGDMAMRAWKKTSGAGYDAVGVWKYVRQSEPELYLRERERIGRLVSQIEPRFTVRCIME